MARLNAKIGTRFLGVKRSALQALTTRSWRGNVRELDNVLERAMVLGGGELISLPDLSEEASTAPVACPHDLREAVRQLERRHLTDVLDEARGVALPEAERVPGRRIAAVPRGTTVQASPGI